MAPTTWQSCGGRSASQRLKLLAQSFGLLFKVVLCSCMPLAGVQVRKVSTDSCIRVRSTSSFFQRLQAESAPWSWHEAERFHLRKRKAEEQDDQSLGCIAQYCVKGKDTYVLAVRSQPQRVGRHIRDKPTLRGCSLGLCLAFEVAVAMVRCKTEWAESFDGIEAASYECFVHTDLGRAKSKHGVSRAIVT